MIYAKWSFNFIEFIFFVVLRTKGKILNLWEAMDYQKKKKHAMNKGESPIMFPMTHLKKIYFLGRTGAKKEWRKLNATIDFKII